MFRKLIGVASEQLTVAQSPSLPSCGCPCLLFSLGLSFLSSGQGHPVKAQPKWEMSVWRQKASSPLDTDTEQFVC